MKNTGEIVAIIGRENVGKSTLFNRLLRRKKAITDMVPGVTRDYLIEELRQGANSLLLADSGGYADIAKRRKCVASMAGLVSQNLADLTINARAVLLVVDGRAGLQSLDEKLSSWLRSLGKEVLLLVNKVDSPAMSACAQEFHKLGWPQMMMLSALGGRGVNDVRAEVLARFGAEERQGKRPEISVAIVGRPNVGKSSIFNCLLGFERSIVYERPGTTRDAVDSLMHWQGNVFRFIDTAGLYKRRRKQERLARFSMDRAKDAIKRADYLLLVMDVTQAYHSSEGQITRLAQAAGKNIVILLNKWDLVRDKEKDYKEYLKHYRQHFRFLGHAHILTVSALESQRIKKILPLLMAMAAQQERRIATGPLGRLLSAKAPLLREEVKYISQVGVKPPTFLVKARGGKLHFSRERALVNFIRKEAGFSSCAIRLEVK